MENFKTRLITECNELEEKLNKLDNFLMSEKIEEIDDVQKARLKIQAFLKNIQPNESKINTFGNK